MSSLMVCRTDRGQLGLGMALIELTSPIGRSYCSLTRMSCLMKTLCFSYTLAAPASSVHEVGDDQMMLPRPWAKPKRTRYGRFVEAGVEVSKEHHCLEYRLQHCALRGFQ